MAPETSGPFGGDLLVGNFGDGQINAFALNRTAAWHPPASFAQQRRQAVAIDGLWALQFGNGRGAGPTNTLFFTAGPGDENDGLFGTITAAS